MKKALLLSAAALLIMSCAHGKTEHFPALDNPHEAAEIYVIRDNNLLGWGFSLKVVLDNAVIAGLRSGEYVGFYVKPGLHSLGISEPTITVPFEKAHTYYFLISADYSSFGFHIRRIGDEKGKNWLTKTTRIE
jgi:hypothetical protein